MAIVSYKMGPGTLKFGPAGILDATCQVKSCVITCEENVETTDAVDVLCGEQLPGDETVTLAWGVEAEVIQDITLAGFVAWSWTNKKTEMAMEFIPNTVAARKVTGTVIVVPLSIGGDAKTRPTSDLKWRGKTGVDFVFTTTP